MGADPIVYCLKELSDYEQFERLCHDLMIAEYPKIEPLGGFKDKGRDAIHVCAVEGKVTVFAYSVREDWRQKLGEDAAKIRAHQHKCNQLVFVTTEAPTACQRDEAAEYIRTHFGWALDLYGLERLRVLLSTTRSDLVEKHPHIFNPQFFRTMRRADLRVDIAPTRQGRQQMAQIRLFNRGDKPVFVASWYATWGDDRPSAISSIRCARGSLPVRLEEHNAYDFLVWLENHPVEELRELGVEDGERHRWSADDEAVKAFVAAAVAHRPPGPTRALPTKEDLCRCRIDVLVSRHGSAPGIPDGLTVTLRNDGPVSIPIAGAKIEWKYNPPRVIPSAPGKPQVSEVSGSVGLAPASPNLLVGPREELRFWLRSELASTLTDVLREDVADDDISIVIWTEVGMGWSQTGDVVAAEVRAVARSVIASWDQR